MNYVYGLLLACLPFLVVGAWRVVKQVRKKKFSDYDYGD